MDAETRWLDAEQQAIWREYLAGTARLIERLERDLQAHHLSLAEYEVLVRLSEAPDRQQRMSDLAASVNLSRSRLTHTVARMETAGLVHRASCPEDRRGILARLTDEGYERLVAAAPDHVAGVRAALVDAVDPADFAAVGRAFRAVARQPISKDCPPEQ